MFSHVRNFIIKIDSAILVSYKKQLVYGESVANAKQLLCVTNPVT